MDRLLRTLLLFACVAVFVRAETPAVTPSPVYELRVYTTHPGKMPDLLARFRNHTCKLLSKHGIVCLGFALPRDKADTEKLYYLVRHKSREVAKASWKAFGDDPEWKAVYTASEANGKIVAGVESIYLTSTDYSPGGIPSIESPTHVFELRTYITNEGKLDALDARFREHTLALFERHGMTNLAYWHPTDADKGAGKTLIYVLSHDSREAAVESWKAFRADPEWIKVRTESEKNGTILQQPPQSVFLSATDFSPIK